MNPFENVPTPSTAEELIDLAFRRARRAGRGSLTSDLKRIEIIRSMLCDRLLRIVRSYPRIERIPAFYRELLDVLVGEAALRKALYRVKWCADVIDKLAHEYRAKIRGAQKVNQRLQFLRSFYGRVSSLLREIEGELDLLREASVKLRKLPSINPELFTIVVSGYTNVGKSSLVRVCSSAKPRVESYPFTTQEIIVGHGKHRGVPFQIIDTPGLLDRPLSERNRIELQAILALKHLPSVIVFLIDPSETCGFPIVNQINLYREIKHHFGDRPIILAFSKKDLVDEGRIDEVGKAVGDPFIAFSSLTREGVDELLDAVISYARVLPQPRTR